MKFPFLSLLFVICFGLQSCGQQQEPTKDIRSMFESNDTHTENNTLDTATLAAGCFWCVEAQFMQLKGVTKVKSGYTGGNRPNPSYEQVTTGVTGHAEALNITFDPSIISYDELLAAFFVAHDPTQLNRQGNDIGTQYRSAIFPRNEAQAEKARYYIEKLNTENVYDAPIVTTVEPFKVFYDAEAYHDDYFRRNPQNPYCQMVVRPKVEKFEKVFKDKLK